MGRWDRKASSGCMEENVFKLMSYSKPAFLGPTCLVDCRFLLWRHLPVSMLESLGHLQFLFSSPLLDDSSSMAITLSFSSLTFKFLGPISNSFYLRPAIDS